MRKKNFISQMGAIACLALAGSVHAVECNHLAPGNDLATEDYYLLDEPAIDLPTIKQADKFAKRLAGRWHGTQLELSCKGHFTSPHKDYNQYRISAEISTHFNGGIRLEAEKERESDRTIKIEKMFFTPETKKDRLGREIGWRSYVVEFIDDNTLLLIDKYRVRNRVRNAGVSPQLRAVSTVPGVTGATRLLHEVKKITLDKNSLKIDRTLYVNGYFVAQDGWLLERG